MSTQPDEEVGQSPLQINADTELIEITDKKFKFINCKFKRPKHRMFDCDVDVKLRAASQVYQAHRDVLREASSYFDAMFSSDFREKDQDVIELHDLPPIGFDAMLEYFYRGYITISDENVGEVVEAARFFQSDWLLSACRVFLIQHFVFGKPEDALAIADTYQLGDLWDISFQFLGANFAAFIERGSITRVNFKVLLNFLKSDTFVAVSEGDILRTIAKFWADSPGLRVLLASLRLGLLSSEDLSFLRLTAGLCPADPKAKKDKKDKKEKKDKKKKTEMSQEEKKADEEALNQLTKALQEIDNADIDALLKTRSRGARPVLVVVSSLAHNVILQFVQLYTNTEPVCLEVDTMDKAPVALEAAALIRKEQFLLCLGGYDAAFCSSPSCAAFNPSALSWTPLAPMLHARVSHAVTETPYGIVVVGGVRRYVNAKGVDVEEFLPFVEMFVKGQWRKLPNLPKAVFDHSAAFAGDALYVSGGITDDPNDPIPTSGLFRLRLDKNGAANGSWEAVAPMQHRRQQHVMVAYEGRLLVFGGTSVSSADQAFGQPEPCLNNEVFDPTAGAWSALPETPAHFRRIFNPHVVVDDCLYLCAGEAEAKYLRCFHLGLGKWLDVEGEDCLGEICTHLAYLEVGLPM